MFITPHLRKANPLSGLFGGDSGGMITSFMPLILIIVIMYFLVLRPQQQKVKQHQAMIKALRRGDTVVTNGGLVPRSPRWWTTTRSKSKSQMACGFGRCARW